MPFCTFPEVRTDLALRSRTLATVLVVEDDAHVRSIIRRTLERGGHEVVEADSGRAAVDLFKKTPEVDLVITDLAMPQQGGIVTIDRIRELDGNVPIIAISGEDDPHGPLNDAMLMGANMRIGKPFRVDELLAAVSVLLEEGE